MPSCVVLLLQRVYWDPNEGKLDQVKDYVADVMIGDIDIAKADPVIAATGAAVST